MHARANHKTYHNARELRYEQPKLGISEISFRTQMCRLETGRPRRRERNTRAKGRAQRLTAFGIRPLPRYARRITSPKPPL